MIISNIASDTLNNLDAVAERFKMATTEIARFAAAGQQLRENNLVQRQAILKVWATNCDIRANVRTQKAYDRTTQRLLNLIEETSKMEAEYEANKAARLAGTKQAKSLIEEEPAA